MESQQFLDEVCVKCGRPQVFPGAPNVFRCPYCKDFFKPQAERIFLYEEELHRLNQERPGRIFFRKPWLKRFLLAILVLALVLAPGFWRVLPGLGVLTLLIYNRQMLRHPISSRIQWLESELQTLVRDYEGEIRPQEEES